MILLDSNIFIYATQPDYNEMRHWLLNETLATSEIVLVEVLGYHLINEDDKKDLETLFDLTKTIPVSWIIIEKAIALRQQRKMSLGDAIIAATALINNLTLVTRNTGDFSWIESLTIYNPID